MPKTHEKYLNPIETQDFQWCVDGDLITPRKLMHRQDTQFCLVPKSTFISFLLENSTALVKLCDI